MFNGLIGLFRCDYLFSLGTFEKLFCRLGIRMGRDWTHRQIEVVMMPAEGGTIELLASRGYYVVCSQAR